MNYPGDRQPVRFLAGPAKTRSLAALGMTVPNNSAKTSSDQNPSLGTMPFPSVHS
jgi:hypothetical protein